MHSRKLLPLGATVLLAAAALIAWWAGAPSVPSAGALPTPATLPGEPAAPVVPAAQARSVPVAPPTPVADAPPPSEATRREPAVTVAGAGAGAGQGTAPGVSASGSTASTSAPAATQEPTVSKDDIRGAVREVLPGLRRCYAPVAARDASAHKVVVRFTLVGQGSSGFFKDADILEESTLDDPIFLSCFLQELSQARFRAPWGTGEVTITYPFTLAGNARDGG
jgi:hypothetical protein